jgi:hypothetical protein
VQTVQLPLWLQYQIPGRIGLFVSAGAAPSLNYNYNIRYDMITQTVAAGTFRPTVTVAPGQDDRIEQKATSSLGLFATVGFRPRLGAARWYPIIEAGYERGEEHFQQSGRFSLAYNSAFLRLGIGF